jgi:tetratricopeptide (TPR) repeat protein
MTQRAVSLDARDPSAWYMRSNVLLELGRLDEALAANARAETLDAFNTTYAANRSRLLLLLDRPQEALAAAQRALDMETSVVGNSEGFAIGSVCSSLMLLGRYAEALPACERTAAQSADWEDQVFLAAGYAQQGDAVRAAIARNELMNQRPHFTVAKYRALQSRASTEGYQRRLDQHVITGLRKTGAPER